MKNIKRAIITGAAGFTGVALVKALIIREVEVYAIVRPNSIHNIRLNFNSPILHIIELFPEDYSHIHEYIDKCCDVFFHLMWTDGLTLKEQIRNVDYTLEALRESKNCGCFRFICTGSQAEYGIVPPTQLTIESLIPNPITSYGVAKVDACKKSKNYAKENNIEWVWCRIFSLIGKYEPSKRMLPSLFINLNSNITTYLSSCRQNWDYLDVHDAADALIALAEYGYPGEIYNIASGQFRPLKEYTELLKSLVSPNTNIVYGSDPNPFISLQPSIEKISQVAGWIPSKNFKTSIKDYYEDLL